MLDNGRLVAERRLFFFKSSGADAMWLLQELKRRNVIKVAIAYIVGAWILLQVADVVALQGEIVRTAATWLDASLSSIEEATLLNSEPINPEGTAEGIRILEGAVSL